MDKEATLLQNQLKRLSMIYEKLKALNQWNQLKQDELKRHPFGTIRFVDSIDQDIMNLYGEFTVTAGQSEQVFRSIKRPSDSIVGLKKQIDILCNRIYYFGSGVNFV